MTTLGVQIAVLSGDGIGPEVTDAALHLLHALRQFYGFEFQTVAADIGGIAYDRHGTPLPSATVECCRQSDAILLGAVGGPKWDSLPGHLRPEAGLLGIRKALTVFANLRPIRVWNELLGASPLRERIVKNCDFIIVRELTGGLYFGEPKERRRDADGNVSVVDTLAYTEREIERIVRVAFDLAMRRKKHLTSVDKANVLESSRLWREVVQRVRHEYPEVLVEHLLVDSAAMQIIQRPGDFDVMVTENLFGDILSDEAAVITGSIGMLPSASLSAEGPGLYEPVHGSAPDIAGQGYANPLASFLSVAMMLEHSLQRPDLGRVVETAVAHAIESGARTRDLARGEEARLSTREMTRWVISYIEKGVHYAENTV